jgi:hypothetical protein
MALRGRIIVKRYKDFILQLAVGRKYLIGWRGRKRQKMFLARFAEEMPQQIKQARILEQVLRREWSWKYAGPRVEIVIASDFESESGAPLSER